MSADARDDLEDQARDLLHLAASTIEVAPAGPIALPERRPRWPMLVAAAAVAALIVGTAVLAGRTSPPPDPTPPPAPRTAEVVPPVLGLTVDEATARLEDAGYDVTVESRRGTCEAPTRVLGTEPETGEPMVGGAVLLAVPQGNHSRFCPEALDDREEAWALLDLVTGRGSTLSFADEVTVRVDGADRTLTRDEVTDPGSWQAPAALARITDAVAAPGTSMTVQVGPGESSAPSCGYPDPPELDSRAALTVVLSLPHVRGTKADRACQIGVDLYETAGAIDTVVLTTGLTDVPDAVMPRFVGLSESEARSAVAAAGADTQVGVGYRESGCDASGRVSAQTPRAGTQRRLQDPVYLVVAVDTAGCDGPTEPTPADDAVARAMIDFADGTGGPTPLLAEEVELFVGNSPVGTFTRAELATPGAWSGCPAGATSYAARACPVTLLDWMRYDAEAGETTRVVSRPDPLPCGGGLVAAGLPERLTALRSVFLEPGESSCLHGIRLQLVLNDQDLIVAANVMLEEP